jgi:hypothetical protein
MLYQAGLGQEFWPLACPYWCCAYNATHPQAALGNKSAHAFKYPNKALPNIQPFGRNCTFVPAKADDKRTKFATRAVDAICVGHVTHPGGLISQEMKVIPLESFLSPGKEHRVYSTRDVKFSLELNFPIRELQHKARYERFKVANPTVTEAEYINSLSSHVLGPPIAHPIDPPVVAQEQPVDVDNEERDAR